LPLLDSLYGAGLRLTRNAAEAEDLVQDTAVRAYRFWHTFKPGTSAKAWLFTILRNTFINGYHRKTRQRELAGTIKREAESHGNSAGLGEQSERAPTPESAVAHKLSRGRIMAALDSLPEDYRVAVTMADLEGLAYREIAEVMSCPIGTVMSRIYRGRRLLHGMLRAEAVEMGLVEGHSEQGGTREAASDPSTAAGAISMKNYRNRG
jgi:RNA polymerase sigma-70 factor (ECF subfamily)